MNQLLNVHVPHYTHMFSLLSRLPAEGARFGHLFLPGGSASLTDPRYSLEPGVPSEAPTVGVLMQVSRVSVLDDGRLAVEAYGLCRFEVLRPTQETPYSRADVRLLPDAEEVEAAAVPSVFAPSTPPERVSAASRAAAAASMLLWASREVRPFETDRILRGGELTPLSIGVDWTLCAGDADDAAADAITELAGRVGQLDQEGAEKAAAAAVSAKLLRVQEGRAWCELIRCLQLSHRVRTPYATVGTDDAARLVLVPPPLLQLAPPPPDTGWPDGAMLSSPDAQPEGVGALPPARRAQRFSFQVASLLPELDSQLLLEADSTSARLQIEIEHLCELRQHLAGLLTSRQLDQDEDDGYPSATG